MIMRIYKSFNIPGTEYNKWGNLEIVDEKALIKYLLEVDDDSDFPEIINQASDRIEMKRIVGYAIVERNKTEGLI